MYSELRNVQILLGLLKKYNIKKIVMSSGTTSVPVIHSIEEDSYFESVSVVDERSAAYFAMGLAQESKEPVVLVCTSGTAVCNYFPAITEAHYQKVPIIVVTCDKRPFELNQKVLQKIDQSNIFRDKCCYATDIPMVVDRQTQVFCERKINEAFIESVIKGKGPAQINLYTGGNRKFTVSTLPKVRKIEYINDFNIEIIEKKKKELRQFKKIMVLAGESVGYSEDTVECIKEFEEQYNCVIVMDHMGNLPIQNAIKPFRVLESMSLAYFKEELCPDLVISFGGNILSGKLNDFLCQSGQCFINWNIEKNGEVVDSWGSLADVYECTVNNFFVAIKDSNCTNNRNYYNSWKKILDETPKPQFPFSHMFIAEQLARAIPENSILHLGILNSTRVMQFYDLKKDITVYSNIGALGIDGSLSSFMGQAYATDKPCFLLIGDLSFLYDMGALNVRYLKSNIHIILINNGGGGEFYFNIGKDNIPCIDDYIAAAHSVMAKDWVVSRGFEYYPAYSESDFCDALEKIMNSNNSYPKFIEAFTNKDIESNAIHDYYESISHRTVNDNRKKKIKTVMKSILGNENTSKIMEKIKMRGNS